MLRNNLMFHKISFFLLDHTSSCQENCFIGFRNYQMFKNFWGFLIKIWRAVRWRYIKGCYSIRLRILMKSTRHSMVQHMRTFFMQITVSKLLGNVHTKFLFSYGASQSRGLNHRFSLNMLTVISIITPKCLILFFSFFCCWPSSIL